MSDVSVLSNPMWIHFRAPIIFFFACLCNGCLRKLKMQNIQFPVFSRLLRARSKHGIKQKEASQTQKVFLNPWKVTIYKPVRLIHLPEMLKPSHDTLTSCKTQTHTVSTVRDDHSPRASRWTVTGVFTLQPCQLVWGEEGLVYLGWFILLSCPNSPSPQPPATRCIPPPLCMWWI